MINKKIFWAIFVLSYVVSAGVFYILGSYTQAGNNKVEVMPPKPLGEGGLLVIAIAVDDISKSVNTIVTKENPGFPPIKLRDSADSYKTANGWVSISDDMIVVFLYRDISTVLTKEELRAVVLHEVCHAKLKHSETRILKQEVDADLCSFSSGASPGALISAINKLSMDDYETIERVKILEQLP